VYVVTAPTVTEAGFVVQLKGDPVPEIFQVTPPLVLVGAVPAVPVTVAVNVMVEPRDPPPELVKTTVGATLAITTETGAVAANAVKLVSPE
jgi:hypothetical protein